jgi:Domain of unknown function (DUF4160)
MPTVLRLLGFRFHFYSDEGNEPPHIHVDIGDGACKFWLNPVRLAGQQKMSTSELRKAERLVFENQSLFLEKFYEYHGR